MPRLNEESKAEPEFYDKGARLRRVHNVYCKDDGHRRVAVPIGEGTESAIPARITVYCRATHKNIAVTGQLVPQGNQDWTFTANPNAKNAYVFDSNHDLGA